VEKLLQRRHVLLKEPAIGTDRIATEWNRAGFGDVLFEEGQRLVLGLFGGHRGLVDRVDQSGLVCISVTKSPISPSVRDWRE